MLASRKRSESLLTLNGAEAIDPLATLGVTALIHWQALRLWRKRAPVYDHVPVGTVPKTKNQAAA